MEVALLLVVLFPARDTTPPELLPLPAEIPALDAPGTDPYSLSDPVPWFRWCLARGEAFERWYEARRSRDELEKQRWRYRDEDYAVLEAYFTWHHDVYDRLTDCWWSGFDEERRLAAAQGLRELLGDHDFYAGRLPGPLPRFGR